MRTFASMDSVHEALERLIARALVERLERLPGQKEERYTQLLGELTPAGFDASQASSAPTAAAASLRAPSISSQGPVAPASVPDWAAALHERLAKLEREVAELRAGAGGASVDDDLYPLRS
jgi:uncharacterized protein YceH (UPF0502 family)